MIVKELIEKLQTLDQSADVLCYTEEEVFQDKGHIFKLLDIVDIGESDAIKKRGDDYKPTLVFGKSKHSQKHVLIEVTGDF